MTNHSTGPKTPEGKSRCRLNAYRHGLTGQLNVFTPEEQQAYEEHCKIIHEALAPVGDYERKVAQSIAADEWRLERARAIEDSTFALGMHGDAADSSGHPGGRRCLRPSPQLVRPGPQSPTPHGLHPAHPARLGQEYSLPRDLASQAQGDSEGRHERGQAPLSTSPSRRQTLPTGSLFHHRPGDPGESVFSIPQVARELSREILLADATTHWVHSPRPARIPPSAFAEPKIMTQPTNPPPR